MIGDCGFVWVLSSQIDIFPNTSTLYFLVSLWLSFSFIQIDKEETNMASTTLWKPKEWKFEALEKTEFQLENLSPYEFCSHF